MLIRSQPLTPASLCTVHAALITLLLVLLTACQKPSERLSAIQQYQLPDNSNSYASLVDKDPSKLNKTELYNRVLSLWETPFRELRIPTRLGEAHVIVSGDSEKPALVLLHGMNTNSTMWYPNINWLSRYYHVYAIDYILGPGKSKASGEIHSTDQVIDWYLEVFDRLKLKQLTVVGASQGGWFATKIAISDRQRIRKLVLLSPAQTFDWIQPSVDAFKNILFALNPKRSDLRATLETLSNNVDGISQLYIDQFYRITESAPSPPLVTEMTPFEKEELGILTMPTLLLIGDEDIINSPDNLETARKYLPCVVTEKISNSGHFLSSDSANIVNQKIRSFIDSTDEKGAGCKTI